MTQDEIISHCLLDVDIWDTLLSKFYDSRVVVPTEHDARELLKDLLDDLDYSQLKQCVRVVRNRLLYHAIYLLIKDSDFDRCGVEESWILSKAYYNFYKFRDIKSLALQEWVKSIQHEGVGTNSFYFWICDRCTHPDVLEFEWNTLSNKVDKYFEMNPFVKITPSTLDETVEAFLTWDRTTCQQN